MTNKQLSMLSTKISTGSPAFIHFLLGDSMPEWEMNSTSGMEGSGNTKSGNATVAVDSYNTCAAHKLTINTVSYLRDKYKTWTSTRPDLASITGT